MDKVEPPNWWIGLPDPMVMFTGSHLEAANVTTSYPGVRVTRTEAGLDGRYFFVWLSIGSKTQPGDLTLKVSTPAGAQTVSVPLAIRSSESGRFQGLAPEDVIYLIMPDRFADGNPSNNEPDAKSHTFDRSVAKAWHGGDLAGVRQHLDYLHDLGVTALWLTPFWKNDWQADDHSYHGYHVVDFYSVDEHLGSLEDARQLVSAAHELGMKVVLDYVVNHTGPRHPWADAPPTRSWLHGTPQTHLEPVYSFEGLIDPHASAREYRGTVEGWFAGKLPDLNPDDPRLAKFLLDNAIWWTESTGLDAYRLDTFPYSSREFWGGWHESIFRAYPRAFSIGEVWSSDVTIPSFFQGGRVERGIDTHLTSVFDFPLQAAIRDVILHGKPVGELVHVLSRDWLYANPDVLVTFFGNHDMRRFMSEEGASLSKLESAFGLLATLRGIPQIYYGDEIGMAGGDDPDNRRDFPGGFPGDTRDAFRPSGRTPEEQAVFRRLQELLSLRKQHPALSRGKQWNIGWNDGYYAFLRENGDDRILVVFNNATTDSSHSIPLAGTPLEHASSFQPLLGAPAIALAKGILDVRSKANSVAVYAVK